ILYLAIVKPVGETYGGRIAAPVVSKAANVLIDSLGFGRGKATSVTHTGLIRIPKNKPVVLGDIVPDFSGVPKKMLTPLFERSDIIVRISGDGYVVGQSPEAGTPVEKGMTIDLVLE
ncbi:MAG TPA: PASTA domain-containing protein, partial [Treponemataceae bacterium]|nr:PASTA domain-containing protein [Treponemataceae bacterium]